MPVEDLEDPADVMQVIKKRLEQKLKHDGQSMVADPTQENRIDRAFF